MSTPILSYNPRSRQVSVVLMTSLVGAMLAFFMMYYLPGYVGTLTASDGKTMFLVARQRSPEEPGPSFAFMRTADGTTFGPMNVRSGSPISAAIVKGDLYCLFADGHISRFGDKPDDWEPIRFRFEWDLRGLASFDDALWIVGQDPRTRELLTARLDNGTWMTGPTLADTTDNLLSVQSAQAEGRRMLLWSTTEGEGGSRTYRLAGAEMTDNALVRLPSLRLDGPARFSALARGEEVDLFYWDSPAQTRLESDGALLIRRVALTKGGWGESETLDVKLSPEYAATGAPAVGRVGGRTCVYGFRYALGLIYWGLYGVELREEGASQPFLAREPLPVESQMAWAWVVYAGSIAFIVGGALAGVVMLRRVESKMSAGLHAPYAAVTERALAAGFDGMLLYTLMDLIPGEWAAAEFWVSFALAYVCYGAFTEAAGGQTLGKKVLGLRVLTINGEPVSLLHAFRRNIFKVVEILTVGVGCCLVSSRFQRPGDFLAGTVVIKELKMPRHVEEGEGTEP